MIRRQPSGALLAWRRVASGGPPRRAETDSGYADACPIPADRARDLAMSFLALLEGAFILSLATRNTEPIEVAGRTAAAAVEVARR
jgi:hypothetical protein